MAATWLLTVLRDTYSLPAMSASVPSAQTSGIESSPEPADVSDSPVSYDLRPCVQRSATDPTGACVTTPADDLGGRLATPGAAAIAGVLFAALLGTSTVMLQAVRAASRR